MATYNTTEPDSLEQLQSSEQVALLDAIDRLRSQGVSHYDIGLPQLIVCGDQSSGKSSVLEGITRLPFPTKDGLCTTFATEVVLRKETEVRISCTILPSKSRSPAEARELAKFKKSYTMREDFSFPALVDEARERMALGADPDHHGFFEDVLQIRYAGPDLPSLTIVDLPGIIQSQVGRKSEISGSRPEKSSAKVIQKLVEEYMKRDKSIILAVVSARNDLENQLVFEMIKTEDPEKVRTLGIITKPDTLDRGSDSEARFVRLLNNEEEPLQLGWHVVKNRSFSEREHTNAQRDESERRFFDEGVWASLPRSDVGIDSLRTRLSNVLLRHIRNELPGLIDAIQNAISSTESKLKTLGDARETHQQQRIFLTSKAESFQRLTDNALGGIYGDPFFALSASEDRNATRLRTEIQNLNLAFAHVMYSKGHTWSIDEDQDENRFHPSAFMSSAFVEYDAASDEPYTISRSEFLNEYIGKFVQQSRPSGLPSLVNPWVIGEVFRSQAQKWEHIAKLHLARVFRAVEQYLQRALKSLMDSRTLTNLYAQHIGLELEAKETLLKDKLDELLEPFTRQEPLTYDPRFLLGLEEVRAKRYMSKNNKNASPGLFSSPETSRVQLLIETMDDYTNSEILDLVQTYYNSAISVFVNNVAILAVENCLVANLSKIFAPSFVAELDDEKLRLIASEDAKIRAERASLKQKLADLKLGKRVLNIQACDTTDAVPSPPSAKVASSTPRPSRAQSSRRSQISRSRTPTPRRKDTGDELSSNFDRLSVSPARTPRQSISSSRSTPTKHTTTLSEPAIETSYKFTAMRNPEVVTDSEDDDMMSFPVGPAGSRQPIPAR